MTTAASPGSGSEMAAAWYLKSEAGEPLGQIHRHGDEAVPTPGAVLEGEVRWRMVEVVQSRALGPTCAMQRFAVVVHVLE